MSKVAIEAKVSHRGQMSLPAETRRRWGLDDGGSVGIIDLDGALLLVPGGLEVARRAIHAALGQGRYEAAVSSLVDDDLMTQ